MNLQTPGVIVDPVPAEGGIINGSGKVGFDSQGRVILTYHKFDDADNTQAYNARWEGDRSETGGWAIYCTSEWDYRWWFEGGGSIVNDVVLGEVAVTDAGLALDFRHVEAGAGRWLLDETTLQPVETLPPVSPLPGHLMTPDSDFPEMRVRLWEDDGRSPDPAVHHLLRWETLPANRDRPRAGPLPEPSVLRLYTLQN